MPNVSPVLRLGRVGCEGAVIPEPAGPGVWSKHWEDVDGRVGGKGGCGDLLDGDWSCEVRGIGVEKEAGFDGQNAFVDEEFQGVPSDAVAEAVGVCEPGGEGAPCELSGGGK